MIGAIAITAAWNGIAVKDAAMGVVKGAAMGVDKTAGRAAETAARMEITTPTSLCPSLSSSGSRPGRSRHISQLWEFDDDVTLYRTATI